MKNDFKSVLESFWTLTALFILILAYFAMPLPKRIFFPVIFLAACFFFLFGLIQFFLAWRLSLSHELKTFLMIMGGAAFGFLPSILLHNFLYGLMIYFFGQDFWLGGDESFFFLFAFVGCPALFLIGMIGGWRLIRCR